MLSLVKPFTVRVRRASAGVAGDGIGGLRAAARVPSSFKEPPRWANAGLANQLGATVGAPDRWRVEPIQQVAVPARWDVKADEVMVSR